MGREPVGLGDRVSEGDAVTTTRCLIYAVLGVLLCWVVVEVDWLDVLAWLLIAIGEP